MVGDVINIALCEQQHALAKSQILHIGNVHISASENSVKQKENTGK